MNEDLHKEPPYFLAAPGRSGHVDAGVDGNAGGSAARDLFERDAVGRAQPGCQCFMCAAPAFYGIQAPGFGMHSTRRSYCGGHIGMVGASITENINRVNEASDEEKI